MDKVNAKAELQKKILELEEENKRLKGVEALYQDLFDNIPLGCSVYTVLNDGSSGEDYIIRDYNRTSQEYEGKTLNEVVGKSFAELQPFLDHSSIIPVFQKVWETGVPDYYIIEANHNSHNNDYYENHIFKTANGELVSVYNNVTTTRNIEAALSESELQNRTLINSIPDLIWLKDLNGVYLSCNPTFERFFGAKESEIRGKTDYDFVDKELADFFRKNDKIAMEADKPCINEELLTFAVDGYTGLFETIKTPVKNGKDKAIGILGIARDITEYRNALDLLQEEQNRYRTAQEVGHVGNWEFNISENKFWASEEAKRIYGFNPDSLDFSVDEVEKCIPERERVHKVLEDLIDKNTPYNIEFEIHPVSGPESRYIHSIAEIIRDSDGAPLKVTGVIHDITDRRKSEVETRNLERQLRQSQKLESVGLLAGGIAHDFNNILSGIIGYTELSLDLAAPGSPLFKMLKQVLTASDRAKELVSQILAFARQSEDEVLPVRVDKVADEALKLMSSIIPATITIEQNINCDLSVMGNPVSIHQIFMNLCSNGAFAMKERPGVLKITLRRALQEDVKSYFAGEAAPNGALEIIVEDTGDGISPEIMDSLFDPYFTTKKYGEGSGMGLAVVHGITKSYGGVINVDSVPGKGASFHVFLPVTDLAGNAERVMKPKNAQGSEHILFVDDEVPVAMVGKALLEVLGYTVSAETSALKALEMFRKNPDGYDLVITDMTMPELTGNKLAAEMMAIRADIPVILFTGYSNIISAEESKAMGIKAFAHKPVKKNQLAELVRNVLDESKSDGSSLSNT
ncbi:MAG: PAS domain-containing protein [Spirochaetales bacterium]|nr:PAS domain-containing protein [Spirochaetales bacterium]